MIAGRSPGLDHPATSSHPFWRRRPKRGHHPQTSVGLNAFRAGKEDELSGTRCEHVQMTMMMMMTMVMVVVVVVVMMVMMTMMMTWRTRSDVHSCFRSEFTPNVGKQMTANSDRRWQNSSNSSASSSFSSSPSSSLPPPSSSSSSRYHRHYPIVVIVIITDIDFFR